MSEPSKNVELKAGHPPAVKAGGMRISSKHHPSQQQHQPTPEEKAEEEEFAEPPSKDKDQGKVIVSGVVTKGNADFKPDAVKVAHDKPIPQHEKRPPGPTGGRTGGKVLQQPRKQ